MGRHGLCMPPKKEIELGNLKVIKKDLVDRNTKIKLLFFIKLYFTIDFIQHFKYQIFMEFFSLKKIRKELRMSQL